MVMIAFWSLSRRALCWATTWARGRLLTVSPLTSTKSPPMHPLWSMARRASPTLLQAVPTTTCGPRCSCSSSRWAHHRLQAAARLLLHAQIIVAWQLSISACRPAHVGRGGARALMSIAFCEPHLELSTWCLTCPAWDEANTNTCASHAWTHTSMPWHVLHGQHQCTHAVTQAPYRHTPPPRLQRPATPGCSQSCAHSPGAAAPWATPP